MEKHWMKSNGKMSNLKFKLHGPFDIIDQKNDVLYECPFSKSTGLYFWSVKTSKHGVKITYIGETSASFYRRTKEHVIQTLGGNYQVCDPDLLVQNQYSIIWNGLWRKGTREKLPEFLAQHESLSPKIISFIQVQKLFVVPFEVEKTLRRRIESKVARMIMEDKEASSLMPHDIRYLKPKEYTDNFTVHIEDSHLISGLPNTLTV